MGELWRSISETMWKRPSVWLPVLIADLIGFFINFGRLALLRSVVMHRTEYHSALGGAPVRNQVTASAAHSVTSLAIAIDWSSYLLRLLLYASALVITAALVRSFRERIKRPWGEVAPALRESVGGIFSLAFRALIIYGVAALLFAWFGNTLVRHGHKAWLAGGWIEAGATLLLMLVLALFLAPVAIQLLARRTAPTWLKQRAQVISFCMGLIALALGTFVTANMRTIRGGPSIGRTLLELTGSWIVALPYAVLFVGLAHLSSEIPAQTDAETGAEAQL